MRLFFCVRRARWNKLQTFVRRWFARGPSTAQAEASRVYLYINGVRDDATVERLQKLLPATDGVSPLVRNARTGCAGLYCHPSKVLEITARVGMAGYSVAGVQFLGAHRSTDQQGVSVVTSHLSR